MERRFNMVSARRQMLELADTGHPRHTTVNASVRKMWSERSIDQRLRPRVCPFAVPPFQVTLPRTVGARDSHTSQLAPGRARHRYPDQMKAISSDDLRRCLGRLGLARVAHRQEDREPAYAALWESTVAPPEVQD